MFIDSSDWFIIGKQILLKKVEGGQRISDLYIVTVNIQSFDISNTGHFSRIQNWQRKQEAQVENNKRYLYVLSAKEEWL